MFEKDMIAIDINKESITILIGTKYKIANGTIIKTPKNSFDNGEILDVNLISEAIEPYIKKAKTKDVSFVVRGEDIITRHLNMPFAKDEAMRDSVDFELRQFMGDRVDEYYFDYQVISQGKNDSSGKCDVLIVACSKDRINSFMEVGKKLKLNVKVIDLYANVVARVFGDLRKTLTKGVKTIGVVGIGLDDSNITILEWGKLALEKYKDNGILSRLDEDLNNLNEYNTILDTVDLIEPKEVGEENEIELYFRDEANDYNNLIQYYMSGKVKKNLDRIYVIGTAAKIKGIEQYFEVNLSSRSAKIPVFSDLKTSVKAPKNINLKDYITCYGLLLRRD